MTDTQRGREFIKRHDGWIAAALFEPADVLLAETGNLGELFLGQTLFEPDPPDIVADRLAHIHAPRSADYIL